MTNPTKTPAENLHTLWTELNAARPVLVPDCNPLGPAYGWFADMSLLDATPAERPSGVRARGSNAGSR